MKNRNVNRIFVDVHVVQSLPPSCVNRDDTGSPKTAVYGGVRRARVSSQAWKRAMRGMFKEHFEENALGKRTALCVEWIAGKILALDNNIEFNEAKQYAKDTINIASTKIKKPIIPSPPKKSKDDNKATDSSDATLFLAPVQVEKIAKLALEWKHTGNKPKKGIVKDCLSRGHTIDIALFGRMVAKAHDLGVDGAAQVAHAISTHRVENEYDYFTAMDDRSPEDQAGAVMIGTVEFNSSTLYRYATVAVHDLESNLDDVAASTKAVREFVHAFICSMPTGKLNTFANNTPPYGVMVAIRRDQPVNLVGAFEQPIRAGDGGYQEQSSKALAEYATAVYSNFLDAPEKAFVVSLGSELDKLGDKVGLSELLGKVELVVGGFLQEGGEKA